MTYDNGPVISGDYCIINVTNLSLPPVVVGLTMSNEVGCFVITRGYLVGACQSGLRRWGSCESVSKGSRSRWASVVF